jgi:hypothetical protein
MDIKRYLIKKYGLYYRPEAAGYTANISEAWKLPYDRAIKYTGSKGYPDEVSLEEAPPAKLAEGIPGFYKSADSTLIILRTGGDFCTITRGALSKVLMLSYCPLANIHIINSFLDSDQISEEDFKICLLDKYKSFNITPDEVENFIKQYNL